MFYGRSYSAGSCTPADGGVCLATVGLLRGAEPPRISLPSGALRHEIAEAIINGQGWARGTPIRGRGARFVSPTEACHSPPKAGSYNKASP